MSRVLLVFFSLALASPHVLAHNSRQAAKLLAKCNSNLLAHPKTVQVHVDSGHLSVAFDDLKAQAALSFSSQNRPASVELLSEPWLDSRDALHGVSFTLISANPSLRLMSYLRDPEIELIEPNGAVVSGLSENGVPIILEMLIPGGDIHQNRVDGTLELSSPWGEPLQIIVHAIGAHSVQSHLIGP